MGTTDGGQSGTVYEQTDETMKLVCDAVSQGKCILFLGAGANCIPPANCSFEYPYDQRPPLGSEFSESLSAKSGFLQRYPQESASNLQRVALDFEVNRSRAELVAEIRKAVDDNRQPSPALKALARLNFPLIVTTNYDHLLEKALKAADKDPVVSVYKKNEESFETTDDYYPLDLEPQVNRPFVFKIHGDIARPESIVITDEDYIQFVLRMSDKEVFHPVPETIRFYFKKWPTLFIGYSLTDYNLRLLFKTLRWKIDRAMVPPTYSVDHAPDPLILAVWHHQRRYIKYIVQDIWSFVPTLYWHVTGEEMMA